MRKTVFKMGSAVLLSMYLAGAANAGLPEGIAAYDRSDYAVAYRLGRIVGATLLNADDVRAILGEIEKAGLSLRDIDVRKPNLEEVFLKLTEEHDSDAAIEGSYGTHFQSTLGHR